MFRFFFQGGFAPMHRPRGHHGHHGPRRHAPHHEGPADPKAGMMSLLFAFLPLLLIIAMNAFSTTPTRPYSMVQTQTFPIRKETYRLHAPFFINDAFQKLSQSEQWTLMSEIDNEYFHMLYNECVKEHNRFTRMGRSANSAVKSGDWCVKFQEAKMKMQPGY